MRELLNKKKNIGVGRMVNKKHTHYDDLCDTNNYFSISTMKVLVTLYNSTDTLNKTTITKRTDVTYSHVVKIVDILSELNIVDRTKTGRTSVVTLTELGAEIAKNLFDVSLHLKHN